MSDFFDNFEVEGFQLSSKASKHSLKFEIWNGGLSLNVWDQENTSRGPVFKKPMNSDTIQLLLTEVKAIIKDSPDTKKPIVISAYDRDEKKYKPNYLLTLIKNGEQMYQLQISHKGQDGEKSYLFDFVSVGGISRGSEQMGVGERSLLRLQSFITWLSITVPVAKVITKRKYTGGGKSGNSGQGGGGGNPGGDSGGGSFFE